MSNFKSIISLLEYKKSITKDEKLICQLDNLIDIFNEFNYLIGDIRTSRDEEIIRRISQVNLNIKEVINGEAKCPTAT